MAAGKKRFRVHKQTRLLFYYSAIVIEQRLGKNGRCGRILGGKIRVAGGLAFFEKTLRLVGMRGKMSALFLVQARNDLPLA